MFAHELAKFVLEALAISIAVGLLAALRGGRRPTADGIASASVIALGAVTIVLATVLAIEQVASGGSPLNRARRSAVSARSGLEYCFKEQGAEARLPFVRWAKARMGPHAVYTMDYVFPPDLLCVYLVMLPALPAVPGEHADWTIAFGAVPPSMQALIAKRDPDVQVFAPGFALESSRGR